MDCPICLEKCENNMITLTCNHIIHTECMKGMIKLECPLCRHVIDNVSIEMVSLINNNSRQFENELEQNDRQNIINSLSYLNDRYQKIIIEICIALRFLRLHGIPDEFIPHIKIDIGDEYYHDTLICQNIIFKFINWATTLDKNIEFAVDPIDEYSMSAEPCIKNIVIMTNNQLLSNTNVDINRI